MYNRQMQLADIKKLATLARVDISDEEATELSRDMDSILGYIKELDEVSLPLGEQLTGDLYNVVRDDDHPRTSGQYTEELLKAAPESEAGFIKVKKVL